MQERRQDLPSDEKVRLFPRLGQSFLHNGPGKTHNSLTYTTYVCVQVPRDFNVKRPFKCLAKLIMLELGDIHGKLWLTLYSPTS